MNIWLISLFDPTPIDEPVYPRFIGIAKAAVALGHTVTHFTSTFRHTQKKHRFENGKTISIAPNYNVHFTHSLGYEKNISFRRFYAHHHYAKKLIKEISLLTKPDIIFISMPPLSTINAITKWGTKNNVPVVIDIIDPCRIRLLRMYQIKLNPWHPY